VKLRLLTWPRRRQNFFTEWFADLDYDNNGKLVITKYVEKSVNFIPYPKLIFLLGHMTRSPMIKSLIE